MRHRIADAIRREVRSDLGLGEGDELRVNWDRVADVVLGRTKDTVKSERRQADVLSDEHKDGSLWISHDDEIWAWVQGDWRKLRNSGLWSGIGLYSGECQMRAAGPFTEVDFAQIVST